jgi:NitT/TauT family transport system permease protein
VEQVARKVEAAEPIDIGDEVTTTGLSFPSPACGRATIGARGGLERGEAARRDFRSIVARWLAAHRGPIRAIVLGALSLFLFLVLWHLLTKYRVNIYVRFLNVPSPEAVFERAVRAFGDPKFLSHVVLSCRRILIGFMLATVIAVPLGLLMGRFRLMRELVFPVTEVLRPIPAIAWVPMSIMLWPTNEESIVFITFLGSFFPILINTLHGMAMIDSVLVRAAQCLGAREVAIFREV